MSIKIAVISSPKPMGNFLYRATQNKARALIIASLANSARNGGESRIGENMFLKLAHNYGIRKSGTSHMETMEYDHWLAEIGNCVDEHFMSRLEHGESWDSIYRSMKPRVYDDGEFCLNFL